MSVLFLLVAAWGDSLPCRVDTLWVHKVSGERVWRGYVTGDILWLSSSMGTALYRPERGPEPRTILAGWGIPFVGGFVEPDAYPPVVFRFSAAPRPALHVARVDPPSGLVEEEVVIPGVPIVQILRISPLLANRFLLVHRTALPGELFRTRVFLFSLRPLALLDTFTLGMGDLSWSSPAVPWRDAHLWVIAPQVPFNRGIPARGSRDDLGGVVFLSATGRVLRTRNLPWPLFAAPRLFCRFEARFCVLNAEPTANSPPGLSGRAWWLRLPDLRVFRKEILPPRTLVIPFQGGKLQVDWDRPGGRWRSPEGAVVTFPLPFWLVRAGLQQHRLEKAGIWFLFRDRVSYIRDPRALGRRPVWLGLLYLTPRGTFHLQVPGPLATMFVALTEDGARWPALEEPDRVGVLRIRCPRR